MLVGRWVFPAFVAGLVGFGFVLAWVISGPGRAWFEPRPFFARLFFLVFACLTGSFTAVLMWRLLNTPVG